MKNMNYDEMLLFVKNMLESNNAIKSSNPNFSFRNRYEHIKRVYNWCIKLMVDCPDCNKEVVLTAAIFHDVGYSYGKEKHNETGANIFLKYARDNNFDENFTNKVKDIILKHSHKAHLWEEGTAIELIIVLEADLLDEEGALGLLWDLMAEGAKTPDSYKQGLDSIYIHSAHILKQDYMVTPLAKKFWKQKQDFISLFIKELSNDLFLNE